MSVSKRLREFLDTHHTKYVVMTHSQAFTAQEVAQRLHVPGREMAKAVVLKLPKGLGLAVVRAPDRVDLERAGAALGGEARLASEREFADAFPDCELGAMPPFGNLYQIPTVVDEGLAQDDEIFFNAGTHTEVIRMTYADYAAQVEPKVAALTLARSAT
ncbi:MAG: deacylase [Candidatus Eisenbacteria bacterium RBG_16_71_46]|nr:MAG: deacylase [Candidatus Eisenbacteria bacterium RBG_16_71_46]